MLEQHIGKIESAAILCDQYGSWLSIKEESLLDFSGDNISIHGGDSISFEKMLLGENVTPWTESEEPFSYLGGFITGQSDFSVKEFSYGLKIAGGLSAGTFDLDYPISYALTLPENVQPGSYFTIDTEFFSTENAYFEIDGPGFDFELIAGLNLEIEGATDVNVNFLGRSIPFELSASIKSKEEITIFDTSKLLPSDYNHDGEYLDYGINIDPNALDGKTSVLGSDPDPKLEITAMPKDPYAWASLDIDDILGMTQLAFSKADFETRIFGLEAEVGLFSADLLVAASPYLKGTVNADGVEVQLTTSYGETKTGKLGDDFSFYLPDDYQYGDFSLSTDYKLSGDVSFEYGIQIEGGFKIKFGEIETDFGWFGFGSTSFSLLEFSPKIAFPIPLSNERLIDLSSIPALNTTHIILSDKNQPTDMVSPSNDGPVYSRVSAEILNAQEYWQSGYGRAWSIAEGDTNHAVTIRLTREGSINTAARVDYGFSFGNEVDDGDFIGGQPVAGAVDFAPGETSKDILVHLRGDSDAEANEILDFYLTSDNAFIDDSQARLIILSDDGLKITGSGLIVGTPDKDVIFSINQEDINQEEGNTILAGADNDQVTVGRNGGTVADGGSGTDRLILDWSAARTDGEYTWLGFSTYDTETATWQTFDDYTVHLSDLKAALASADTLRLDLSYRYGYDSWLEFKNFEQLELTATAGDDLLVHRASGRYDGQAETDTLYADFSTTTEAVLWDNRDPSVAQTLLDGSTVVNIERMLLATGSGNDVIKNTHANSGNDEIDTGAGDDTIEAGGGNDEIDTGAGDDTIDAGNDGGNIEAGDGNDQVTVGRNGGTVADGGSGTDRLILDWSAARADGEYTWLGFSTYDTETATWQTFDYYTVHLSDLKAVLASADTLRLDLSYRYGYDSWLEFKNFEQLELTATAGDDLLVHRASGRYDGQAETDTLYADFSTTTEAVLWDNRDPSVAQTLLDGSTVVNIERMLLATGSGNDVIKNTHANSGNDEIDTGAGDDTIEAGGGNDRIKGGSGTDTAVFSANFADYRIDTIEGGVSVSDLSGNGDGVDELYDVERLQFLDQTINLINHAPTASNRTISTKEDVARVLAVANFGFRDVDAGDSLQAVMLTSLPTAGSLKLNGTAVTVNQVVTVADLAAGKLIFTPAANANGSGYASFGFKVSDGTAVSTAAYSMTVNVTAVNDAPTASNRTVSTKEDVPKVLKVADFGFSDLDANDSLQAVKITSLPTAGSLKLNDTLVTVNQLVTAADILANKLIFIPAANANGSGYASIGFKVSDGKATSTATYSITIDVTLVRDDLILKGTSGNDTLTGDMIDLGSYDRLIGLAGNDSLFGLAGNDTLEGGAGNDILNGGKGSDRMIGGDGSDIYYVDNTGDVVSETNANASTGGIDSVYSSLTDYTLDPNVENGRILSTGTANLTGNQLNNLLKAGIGNNILTGGTGTDTVSYVVGATTEKTGVTLNLALTTAQETGGSGTDTLVGIENLIGSAYADKLTGNSGRNNLSGGVGNDILNGGAGNDILNGDTGNDTLNGGAGNDTLSGGAGKDILNGGAGNDILNGGTGIDIFRFDTALNAASNLDEINNFSVADDTIQLENAIFVKLKMPGTLSATNFRASIDGSAADNNDFILYDTDSGALFYDADGSGTASAIQFAIIGITPALTASDFIVT